MKIKLILIFLLPFVIIGCESNNWLLSDVKEVEPAVIKNDQMLNRIITSLSEQLFLSDKFDFENKKVGVTTFVWADNYLIKKEDGAHKLLEYYLPDSLKVILVQQGINVIEYQTSSSLDITDDAAYYLSRDLSKLSEQIYIDYVLVGSLIETENGVMVTAQVVDIKTKAIVAGAKEYIPREAYYERSKIYIKNNQIYRDGVRK